MVTQLIFRRASRPKNHLEAIKKYKDCIADGFGRSLARDFGFVYLHADGQTDLRAKIKAILGKCQLGGPVFFFTPSARQTNLPSSLSCELFCEAE